MGNLTNFLLSLYILCTLATLLKPTQSKDHYFSILLDALSLSAVNRFFGNFHTHLENNGLLQPFLSLLHFYSLIAGILVLLYLSSRGPGGNVLPQPVISYAFLSCLHVSNGGDYKDALIWTAGIIFLSSIITAIRFSKSDALFTLFFMLLSLFISAIYCLFFPLFKLSEPDNAREVEDELAKISKSLDRGLDKIDKSINKS